MRYLLLLALLISGPLAQAQTPAATTSNLPRYRYCALVVDDRYFTSSNNTLQLLSGGQGTDDLAEVRQHIGKGTSVLNALDYLGSQGWECFAVNTVPSELRASSGFITSETRYLLRKRLP